MEPGNIGVDPRLSFDDPLLDGLLILCKLHGATVSRASLRCRAAPGTPTPEPGPAARAAARAGLQARLLRRELKDISH
jgi:ATP-binding cassette subfamily C protein LapB